MKKTILLICTLLFCFLWLTILAEENGLTGPLGEAVKQSGRWDGYRCLVPQAGNAAVMQGQGRNVLLLFTDGKLRSSFKAVYQPEDGRDGDLSLQWTDEGLILSYGEQEQFCFDTQNPTPWLKSAKLSGVECILTEADYTDPVERYTTYVHEDGYQFIEAESLFSFDIRLFPRTWEEVERFILAKELIGYWVFEAGGAAAWGFECVVFKEDGTYYGNYDFCDFRITEKTKFGHWYIKDSFNGQRTVHELVMENEDGDVDINFLSIGEWRGMTILSLHWGEGGGGYAAVDPSEIKDGFFTGDVWIWP